MKMLPWILGRGLGVAGYAALVALVATGMWFRHPWRRPSSRADGTVHLRVHAALASATAVLVAGHLVALALDRYAGVGWSGAFVPGRSHFRTAAVALGTASFYLGLLVATTAKLAGRPIVRHHWRAVHRLATLSFASVWAHGVLAGSDAAALRPLYVGTGVLLVTMAVTSRYASSTERRLENAV